MLLAAHAHGYSNMAHARRRSWIMLLSDIMLRDDARFRAIVEEYVEDEARWHSDFAAAFKRLTELGMPTSDSPRKSHAGTVFGPRAITNSVL